MGTGKISDSGPWFLRRSPKANFWWDMMGSWKVHGATLWALQLPKMIQYDWGYPQKQSECLDYNKIVFSGGCFHFPTLDLFWLPGGNHGRWPHDGMPNLCGLALAPSIFKFGSNNICIIISLISSKLRNISFSNKLFKHWNNYSSSHLHFQSWRALQGSESERVWGLQWAGVAAKCRSLAERSGGISHGPKIE